jgi:hypothetical protein
MKGEVRVGSSVMQRTERRQECDDRGIPMPVGAAGDALRSF